MSSGIARVGISGWTYRPWRGTFYPPKLPVREELPFAASRLETIEVNGTFYRLQRPTSFARWREVTPPGFVFSVKGGRYITHLLKLRAVEGALANFIASGVLALGEKLGPFLWQLPPTLPLDLETLDAFLALLPRTVGAASELGRRATLAEDRVFTGASRVDSDADATGDDGLVDAARVDAARVDAARVDAAPPDTRLRHALEVRHESFVDPALYELLRRHNVALVVADTAGKWPHLREVTADHVYVRLHGDSELYTSGYSDESLDEWAAVVDGWRSGVLCPDGVGRDVFVYFDNDAKVRAPFDAMGLRERLGAVDSP